MDGCLRIQSCLAVRADPLRCDSQGICRDQITLTSLRVALDGRRVRTKLRGIRASFQKLSRFSLKFQMKGNLSSCVFLPGTRAIKKFSTLKDGAPLKSCVQGWNVRCVNFHSFFYDFCRHHFHFELRGDYRPCIGSASVIQHGSPGVQTTHGLECQF